MPAPRLKRATGWMRSLASRVARGVKVESDKDRLAREGEKLAETFLQQHGYRVIDRNVLLPAGEADLICLDPDERTVAIVEVKTRTLIPGIRTAPPETAVNHEKRRHLLALRRELVEANSWAKRPTRIDIVAVTICVGRDPDIQHFRAAVTGA